MRRSQRAATYTGSLLGLLGSLSALIAVVSLIGAPVWAQLSTETPGPIAPNSQPLEMQRLTLDNAIREALTRAPDLRAASESIAQAQADLKTASLFPNPQFSAGTTLQRLGQPYTPTTQGGPPQYNIDLAQPVDFLLFGKRSAAVESAHRAVDVAEADFDDLKRQRTGDVAGAFFDVLETRAVVELAHTDVDDLRRVAALTRQRIDLGGAAKIDLDRAELAAVLAAQDLRTAETAQVAAFAALRALVGSGESPSGFDVAGALDVPHPAQAPDIDALLATAETSRPNLVSLRHQIEHWEAETTSQQRQAFPTLTVQFGYVYQHQEPIGLEDLNEWEASGTMSLPVFDRNQGNIAKAESETRQAHRSLEAARIALRAELTDALAAFRAATAAVAADDPAQLEAARSVRDRLEAAYENGGRTILELLDGEKAYRDALRFHIHAQSSYWHAFYALNTAVGTPVIANGATP